LFFHKKGHLTIKSKFKIHEGDLFRLGNHRLLCGDSTNLESIKKVAGRNDIHLVFAGPPYFNQRNYSHWSTYDAYLEDIGAVMNNCISALGSCGVVTWLIGRGSCEHKDHIAFHSMMLGYQGLKFQDAIAWIKPGANYSVKRSCHIRLNGFYYPAFRWETVLVYRMAGSMPRMSVSDRKYMAQHHTDVWEIPWVTQQMERYGHPSVCPVEIPRRCILAYAKRKGNVLDPFGGSGTTLIASELTGRKCFLIELKPKYCKIMIHRWESLTGKKAHLV